MPTPTEYAELKLRHWGAPVPQHLSHGPNTSAARFYGCDCSSCLPSGTRKRRGGTPGVERRRNSRHRLRGQPVPEGTKHGVYTYLVYQCRCEACVTAKAEQHRRSKTDWKLTARGVWTEDPETTMLCWYPENCPDHRREAKP